MRYACSASARVGEVDGERVTAQNGRYGPYIKRGSESRSLESEEQLFTVTLDEVKALLAEPPRRRGPWRDVSDRSRNSAPTRRVKPIMVRDGRFGPYVTDGETNASLRRGDTPDGIDARTRRRTPRERRAKSA